MSTEMLNTTKQRAKTATRKKVATKKKVATPKTVKQAKGEKEVKKDQFVHAHVCTSCNALPVGSVELTALLLVLVFSLTAVLVTSVHALALERQAGEQTHVTLRQ